MNAAKPAAGESSAEYQYRAVFLRHQGLKAVLEPQHGIGHLCRFSPLPGNMCMRKMGVYLGVCMHWASCSHPHLPKAPCITMRSEAQTGGLKQVTGPHGSMARTKSRDISIQQWPLRVALPIFMGESTYTLHVFSAGT